MWRGKRPKAPLGASATTFCTVSSRKVSAGVTILSCIGLVSFLIAAACFRRFAPLPVQQFVDCPNHVEIAFRTIGKLVVQDALAGIEVLFQADESALVAGELLGG